MRPDGYGFNTFQRLGSTRGGVEPAAHKHARVLVRALRSVSNHRRCRWHLGRFYATNPRQYTCAQCVIDAVKFGLTSGQAVQQQRPAGDLQNVASAGAGISSRPKRRTRFDWNAAVSYRRCSLPRPQKSLLCTLAIALETRATCFMHC